jgi:hypothetical protein
MKNCSAQDDTAFFLFAATRRQQNADWLFCLLTWDAKSSVDDVCSDLL